MRRLQKFFILSIFLCALLSLGFTQGEEGFHFNIDEAVVGTILTIGGLGVMAITQIVKNTLVKLFNVTQPGVKDILGYISSLIVSAGASAFVLLQLKLFTFMALLGYTIYVWLEVNQIFKIIKKPSPPA